MEVQGTGKKGRLYLFRNQKGGAPRHDNNICGCKEKQVERKGRVLERVTMISEHQSWHGGGTGKGAEKGKRGRKVYIFTYDYNSKWGIKKMGRVGDRQRETCP